MERIYRYLPFAITILLIILSSVLFNVFHEMQEHNRIERAISQHYIMRVSDLSDKWLVVEQNLHNTERSVGSYIMLLDKYTREIEIALYKAEKIKNQPRRPVFPEIINENLQVPQKPSGKNKQ